jgi:dTDP-glucose 4,6-dehydratase
MQVRNWIHVEDMCAGIDMVLERGEAGVVYNLGGPEELANIDVVRKILAFAGRDESLITHVTDRLGHDRRYSLSSERAQALGWGPRVLFEEGLRGTVDWYRENEWWWGPVRSGQYREYYERQYGRALG